MINTVDFLELVTRIVLALVALLALVDFLRHRGRVRFDVALMLASLGIPLLRQYFPDAVSDLRWVRTLSSMAVVAQPYLLLRLVEDLRPVPRTYIGAAIVGMVLSWVALVMYFPLPQAVTLIIIAYFVLVEGYATFALVRGMVATRGPTRWRLGFAAGGSGLLATAILLVGISNLAPGASGATAALRPLLTALAAVSYYLGFAPPGRLTRIWQLPEMHRFLQDIAGIPAAERSTTTARALCQTATRVVGGLASAIFLWDEEQQQLKVEAAEVAALRSGLLSPAEGVTGQVWAEQQPVAVGVQSTLGREENQMTALLGAKTLLVVPIRSGQRAWGLLLVFHIRAPLFPSDDLSVLSILAEQYALALDNADLVAQQNNLIAQLEAANRHLERFAFLASHDLQEPLRMISTFAELLSERYTGRLDADADEFIGYMVDSANRMGELISGLLAFSRLQTQDQPLGTIAAEEAFRQAVANLQTAIEESKALVSHDPLPQVLGDTIQLTQVFQNLIGNAIKFCTQDVPQVHVSAQQSEKEWLISVKDNGIGISPQFHRQIFEIFQRLHGRSEYSGTGLGLALCQRIIERHGGRIWVESEPGQGSTFYFTLPFAEKTEDVAVASRAAS